MSTPQDTSYQSMLATVHAQKWVRPGLSILVACSGGVDSMVLLRLLCDIPELRLGVAHLNHGLRGQSATDDAEFVQNHASRLGIPFYTKQVNIRSEAQTQSVGIEASARQKRYEFLESVRKWEGYDIVATGHTGSDMIETILLNIYRGTGVLGLRGIQAMSDVLVRPLLLFTRTEVEQAADELSMEFRTDPSNADWRYTRNRIRHGWLKSQSPDNQKKLLVKVRELSQIADRVGRLTKESYKYLEKQSVKTVKPGKILLDIPQGSGYFSLLWKALFDKAFQQVTHRETGISENHFQRLMTLMNASQPGQSFQLPGGCDVYRDRQRLVFLREDVDRWEMRECKPGDVMRGPFFTMNATLTSPPTTLKTSPLVQYLTLPKTPWKLRPWTAGDTMQPFGNGRCSKVSDLLQAAKVAPHLKRWWPVLESENEIVWIPGVKTGEIARVRESLTRVARLEIVLETGSFE
ncbi:MAG: tRNA lysidine(34) synthetase TilS [Candidatus Marinimicrobia bacterium]|nr:tRNA lysidine(34) synthetase TilS [Candidatus Neomarinimicrobiota bacterium]MCF7839603.1 tRNA lysidine(34) synthetase TilS [Candidatus Neomarinimicrobiota bacterium]